VLRVNDTNVVEDDRTARKSVLETLRREGDSSSNEDEDEASQPPQ